jgi:hypothetical protein
MFPIASALPSGSGVTFTNIPQTFTHLQVRIFGRVTGSTGGILYLRPNSDFSTSNYRSHTVYGDGSNTYSFDYGTGRNYLLFGMATDGTVGSGIFGSIIIDILDYANTSKNKTFKSIGGLDPNAAGGFISMYSGLWMNTSAVTSIAMDGLGNTLTTGSRVDLYGISTSNATGG